MTIYINRIILFFLLVFAFQSCQKDDVAEETVVAVPEKNTEVQRFIWKAMNSYYLWQDNVPDLSDSRFNGETGLNNFLKTAGTPEDFFQNLLYKPSSKYPTGAVDRFSYMIKDNSLTARSMGITTNSNGLALGFGLKERGKNDVFGYVEYVVPNSNASTKNIKRGDFFDSVNGIKLTTDNYWNLLFGDNANTYTINLLNGTSVELTKTALNENPVFKHSVIETENKKVAYLVYNQFVSDYDTELNAVFGEFKDAGVTDLVLDLRYNGGGAVQTAIYLASMITGQFTGQVLLNNQYNKKAQASFKKYYPENLYSKFTDIIKNDNGAQIPINSLKLNTLYVLTGYQTASASELIINGLKPYINVVQIGAKTVGKNTASIAMYDSPDFSMTNRNNKHNYVLHPLVMKLSNKNNFGDYQEGILPTGVEKYEDPTIDLGNTNETLLSDALALITSSARPAKHIVNKMPYELTNDKTIQPIHSEMYVDTPKGLKNQ